eukprot:CAMPEP_0202393928 /NCGR_PEP_ID=MMETSP1127-20130417/93163_1 /ASSEMBLY_ACC=CAM_ASM_000462 /TAXON_ID=3047 /ORGANISM="Dunaliella tertiolecta, Strain CCMP1320" /LENGTH=300 /DNA_ID=CAMNT_0048996523 /DNA_START=258 /DNA_END=1156 /DNA_ORIENTATION=+
MLTAASAASHGLGAETPAEPASEGSEFSARICSTGEGSEFNAGTCSAGEGSDGSFQARLPSEDSPAAQKKLLLLLVVLMGALLTVRTLLALARQWRMSAGSPASLSPRPSATPSNSSAFDPGDPPLRPSPSLPPSHAPLHSPAANGGFRPPSTASLQPTSPFSNQPNVHPAYPYHHTSTHMWTSVAPAAPLQNSSPFQNPSSGTNLPSPGPSGSSRTSGSADETTDAYMARTFLVCGVRVLDAVQTSTLSLLTLTLQLMPPHSLPPHQPLIPPVSGDETSSGAVAEDGLGRVAAPAAVWG